jgi:hypothetical protein
MLPKAPRPFSFLLPCASLSLGFFLGPCTTTCLHITTNPLLLPLPPPCLLFPEARLRLSLLDRSLTTGCQVIARVGSLHQLILASAMRRFFWRADTPPVLLLLPWAGIGDIGLLGWWIPEAVRLI